MLQRAIEELKSYLEDADAPFGVDLLIPQIGGSARKTNVSRVYASTGRDFSIAVLQFDYQEGRLPEITDIIIEHKAALFVCAVGVPPRDTVDKLHAAGIPVMK